MNSFVIDQVISEQCEVTGGKVYDAIDKQVEKIREETNMKRCGRCGKLNTKTKRKCERCRENLSILKKSATTHSAVQGPRQVKETKIRVQHVQMPSICPSKSKRLDDSTTSQHHHSTGSARSERYDHIPSNHIGKPVKTVVLDPVFVNPNPFQTIILMLRR